MKTAYATILRAYYEAAKSDNFSEDDIWNSVKEVFAGIKDIEGEIQVGDIKLGISNGIVVEWDEKAGGYKVGNLTITNFEDACRAAMLEKAGVKGLAPIKGGKEGSIDYEGVIKIGNKEGIPVITSGDKI